MAFTAQELMALLPALGGEPMESLQIVAAAQAARQHYPHFDPGQPVLLVGLQDGALLDRLRQMLLMAYPPDHPATLIAGEAQHGVALADLTAARWQEAGTPACLLIAALPTPACYAALQDVAAHLRAPEGCPWDRALTWAKLRASLLEETHELLSALDAEDAAKVAEELGDLLLQIAMQTQIAAEAGRFRLPDVIRQIVAKLVRRHPHVFGDAVVSGTDEVLANWEAIKAAERAANGELRSPLAGIPAGLPALAQADAYLDRMSRLRALSAADAPWRPLAELPAGAAVSPEIVGQALFGLVAWARARGIDAESALRAANSRYAAAVAEEFAGGS